MNLCNVSTARWGGHTQTSAKSKSVLQCRVATCDSLHSVKPVCQDILANFGTRYSIFNYNLYYNGLENATLKFGAFARQMGLFFGGGD